MLCNTLFCLCFLSSFLFANGFIFSSGNKLESYNVDVSQISISGISSGAAMATQMHVIHSKTFMGAGMIAGTPFACAVGTVAESLVCMQTPSLVSVGALTATTRAGDNAGNIDSTTNLANDKVYIFDGKHDSIVKPASGEKIKDFYKHFITNPSNIKTVLNVKAEHGQPTDNYGGACNHLNLPTYMNNCNYSAAYDLLNFIYGGSLEKPTTSTQAAGELKQFSQDDFFYLSPPITYSMDTRGYVYIPSGCKTKSKACKLHVALHGCGMGRTLIGETYVKHGGYNEVGELNNIIILYPQVTTTLTNTLGCWDWWGYTGTLYATKNGYQITALQRMVNKVSGV